MPANKLINNITFICYIGIFDPTVRLYMDMFQKELSSIKDLHSNHGDILRVIDFGQKVYKAYIDWCEETTIYFESRNEK